MIIFGALRTEQAAWWNILAWTMRNSATFAPVVAALFWRLATKEAVVGSMIAGFLSGIVWYHLGGWLPNQFYLNIHPVWVGMSANIITIIVITLVQTCKVLKFNLSVSSARKGYYALAGSATLLPLVVALFFKPIYANGLIGIFIFSILILSFISTIIFIPDVKENESRHRTESEICKTSCVMLQC